RVDERKDRPDVAVVTDTLWRERLGGDPAIVGRSIALDGKPYTVVGVLPAGFQIPQPDQLEGASTRLTAKIDAFVALRFDPETSGWAGEHNNAALGRLKRDVSVDGARAELDLLQAQAAEIATQKSHEPT